MTLQDRDGHLRNCLPRDRLAANRSNLAHVLTAFLSLFNSGTLTGLDPHLCNLVYLFKISSRHITDWKVRGSIFGAEKRATATRTDLIR